MKTIVLALLFYFSMTNTVNAEYTWVLWVRVTVFGSSSPGRDWGMMDAFPSYEECKQTQQAKCETIKKQAMETHKAMGNKVEWVIDECPDLFTLSIAHAQADITEFRCLPESITPEKK